MKLFYRILLLLTLIVLFSGTAHGEIVSSHFFSPNTPSFGIYQQEFMKTYINLNPDLTRGYNLLVNCEFQKAIAVLNKVAHDEKLDNKIRSEAYAYLGYAYMNLRDTVHCLEATKKSVELNPENALAYYITAHEYFLSGDFKATEEYLKKAIEIHPKFVSAMRMLAELYKDKGDLKKSAEYYQKIIEVFPNSGYFRYQYYKIAMKLHNWDEAEKTLDKMIELQPKYRTNYLSRGDVYIKQGKLKKAEDEFNFILKQTPRESRAFQGRARIYYKRKEWNRALAQAQIALQLSPKNIYIKQMIADIKIDRDAERKEKMKWILVIAGILAVGAVIAYFILARHRRKYVLSVIQNFNRSVDEIYDLDTMTNYLLSFFMDIGASPRGILLLFNRQNNELYVKESVGFEEDLSLSFNIFAGADMTNWLAEQKRYIMKMDEVVKDPRFDTVFPSLKDRIQVLGLKFILLLREKNSLIGLVALDEFRARGRIVPYESDLLMPLSTTSSQALSTLLLYEISVSDETTGVFNKKYFKQNLHLEVKRAERYKQPVSLVVVDIDNIKDINDKFSAAFGDIILKELGGILRKTIRESIDIASRTGGKEFSLILPSTESDKAHAAAKRLRKAVQDYEFPRPPGENQIKVTVSLGVATFPIHSTTERGLVEKAHQALFLAQSKGENRVCMAELVEEPGFLLDSTEMAAIKTQGAMAGHLRDETGFYAREYFKERYSGELRRSERNSQSCSLILVKPDMELSETERIGIFKEMALIFFANLRRGIDVPARFDRDTIVVLIPDADQHKAAGIARRLKLLVDKSTPLSGEQRVTFSFGISNYPNLGRTEESFLEAALQALRMCQQSGGDSALIATPL